MSFPGCCLSSNTSSIRDRFATCALSQPVFFKNTGWESAQVANRSLIDEVLELRQQPGKDIYVGSRSLIIQLLNLHLIDEFQLCVHPVVVGKGLPLFEHINGRTLFKLIKTKTFTGGAVTLYYEPSLNAEANY